ncbi:MAG TPA: tRNA lysidine(34) synthetase TilS [Candidatus Kapabacteria bacterium]|nr:tRNA lysidine(34) synthetase TilS [Candidatus Kapabacteria bacterium]
MIPFSRTLITFLQQIRRFMRQHEMLLGQEKVLVAVSGGIDSMALLDLMARLAPVMKLELAVAHFDHGLRGEESQEDAMFVVEQAKARGLKSYVGRGDIRKLASLQSLSIEETARKARYQFLSRVARKHAYDVVLTAHNANDNAETLLLNLLRGSGVSGLAGIPPVRPLVEEVIVCRPLLGTERSEIQKYADEVELKWREDATNATMKHTRNRVRHELLPLLTQYNPAILNTLNSTAEIMRGLDQYLSHSVDLSMRSVILATTPEQVDLDINHLKHYLPAIQAEIVQRIVSKVFDIPPVSHGALERTLALIWKETGSKAELGGGLTALRDRERILIRCEPPPMLPVERGFAVGAAVQTELGVLNTELMERASVRFTRNSHVEFVDADKLPETLTLRTWREGDRFHPLGMTGEKKVSDFLVDSKVSLDKKREVLVVADGETIIWVCGMRLDERYKVAPQTQRVLRMELRVSKPGKPADERKR